MNLIVFSFFFFYLLSYSKHFIKIEKWRNNGQDLSINEINFLKNNRVLYLPNCFLLHYLLMKWFIYLDIFNLKNVSTEISYKEHYPAQNYLFFIYFKVTEFIICSSKRTQRHSYLIIIAIFQGNLDNSTIKVYLVKFS